MVKELGLDPGVDTLARWMAHYIAEQLIIIESSTGREKAKAEKECFDTILKLWQHRSVYPNGLRFLMKALNLIFRVLERLDRKTNRLIFLIITYVEGEEANKVPKSVKQWLDIALGIDQIARIWLNYVFKQAALSATDKTQLNG